MTGIVRGLVLIIVCLSGVLWYKYPEENFDSIFAIFTFIFSLIEFSYYKTTHVKTKIKLDDSSLEEVRKIISSAKHEDVSSEIIEEESNNSDKKRKLQSLEDISDNISNEVYLATTLDSIYDIINKYDDKISTSSNFELSHYIKKEIEYKAGGIVKRSDKNDNIGYSYIDYNELRREASTPAYNGSMVLIVFGVVIAVVLVFNM